MSNFFNSNTHIIIREGRHVTLACIFWHIWKARNELIFRGANSNIEQLITSIKKESLILCVNHNLVPQIEEKLWFIDLPITLENNAQSKRVGLLYRLLKDFEAAAFSDGSWSLSQGKGGIGGFIYSKNCIVEYLFFGSSSIDGAMAVELEACKYLCKSLNGKEKLQRVLYVLIPRT